MNNIINNQLKFPQYSFTGSQDEFIFITSLNLGGAEKIVSDQLWANHWNPRPINYTLIVLYDKDKEHPIPPSVNIIRLGSKIENGMPIFKQIAFRNKTLVAHLANDAMLSYMFSLGVHVNLVIHNDQQGWQNKPFIFNHQNINGLIGVCEYVTRQIRQYTDKHIVTIRHQINYKNYIFNEEKRSLYKKEFSLSDSDIVIGMLGRIAWQKNYSKAITTLTHLLKLNPNYKLIIVGGFEPTQSAQYVHMCELINYYSLHQNVILTGFRNDVKDLINVFDCSLNTSHFEGLSMASQELIGNGLTVFAADICGQKEILDIHQQLNLYKPSITEENLAKIIDDKYNITKFKRQMFSDIELSENSKRSWASHRLWNLLNYLKSTKDDSKKFAFLTSNFNLGGAQKSLFNLSTKLKDSGIETKIIVANQSNQGKLYSELLNTGCEVFLATDSIDAFDITNNILNYCIQNKISKIIYWNVDAKLRLLLNKIASGYIDFVDVSPGHYCFEEMDAEKVFIEGIYYDSEAYNDSLHKMVFKYHVDQERIPYYKILKDKTHYIQNGVYLDLNEKTYQDEIVLNSLLEFTSNKELTHFVVCGRIAPSKHLETIFIAFLTSEKSKNALLHIVGSVEPEYEGYFEKLKEKFGEFFGVKIIFHGQCDNAALIMSHTDGLIVLGTHQGCPNIVLEAFSVGIPVIANDSGGTKEIVNESTGILVPEQINVKDLSDAIDCFLINLNQMKDKGQNGKALIKRQFSMDKMANEYIQQIIVTDTN